MDPTFVMQSNGWFRARGINGKALIALAPDGLRITGEKGGNTRILYTTRFWDDNAWA